MTNERGHRHLHAADSEDPIWRLWEALPPEWRGPVLGEGITNWARITENGWQRLDLSGLPDPIPAELAWMAHWQAHDGTRSSVLALAQLANILRRAIRDGHPFPPTIREMEGTRRRRYRAGSTPPAGNGYRTRAAEPGCASCSGSPGWR